MVAVAAFKIQQLIDEKTIYEKGYNPITNAQPVVGSDRFKCLVNIKFQDKYNSGDDEKIFLHKFSLKKHKIDFVLLLIFNYLC